LVFKFKRQVPIGVYILDFVCLEKRLIIELDGSQHLDNQIYDQNHTAWLTEQGFKVLRLWNHDVFQQISSILEAIMKALHPLEIKNREAAQI
jgi:very-short-patch-repair endonuclease